ncbi:MAG: hypothetical protein BGO27_07825 [Alphaproteobacteria bacterium 33-17]|nr:MAG: hypothetical protein BGO27_07825 [Alphaproteobacteria bacterium 33-17]
MTIFLRVIGFLVAFGMLLISGYAFVFVLLALLPTIVAVSIDKRSSRAASNTIGGFNILGVLPYAVELLQEGLGASSKAQAMLTDLTVWFIVYGSASIGWILIWVVPQVFGSYFVYREERKIKTYLDEQKKLYDEWGPKVGFKKKFLGEAISSDDDDE